MRVQALRGHLARPAISFLLTLLAGPGSVSGVLRAGGAEEAIRKHLEAILPDPGQIESFLVRTGAPGEPHPNLGWTYDSELGWVLADAVRSDGIAGSSTYYHYEASGARARINFPDRTARIHTYGNSFTHCDQVSDGETWQEALAAHLREPIENYGVGGYSVYQAYLRMKRVEARHPARWIILNIFDADNFRNLDSWRSIRAGRRRGPGRSPAGFTLPYLDVDVEGNRVVERPNPCPTPDTVRRLSDPEWVMRNFGDDDILHYVIARGQGEAVTPEMVSGVAERFGLRSFYNPANPDLQAELERILEKAALFATRKVVEMVEKLAREQDKKLLVVLSHSRARLLGFLRGEEVWYRELLDYLATRSYPVVDLREAHLAEYGTFRLTPEEYRDRYYVGGHYNPTGNFFTASVLREAVVEWLEPPPVPYRRR